MRFRGRSGDSRIDCPCAIIHHCSPAAFSPSSPPFFIHLIRNFSQHLFRKFSRRCAGSRKLRRVVRTAAAGGKDRAKSARCVVWGLGEKRKQRATSGPRERECPLARSSKKALTRSGRASLTNAISCRGCGCGTGSFFPFGRYFISPVP